MTKFFQTRDVKLEPGQTEPARLKGVSTHEARGLSDRAFVEQRASAEDLAALRAEIEAREKGAAAAWRQLPNGLTIPGRNVLFFCTNGRCGFAEFLDPRFAGRPCAVCNSRGDKTDYKGDPAGHLRAASEKETADHLGWMERDAERRRQQIAAAGLARRNEERIKAGLAPFTVEEYRAECNEVYRAKTEREARFAPANPILEGLNAKDLAEVRASVEAKRFAPMPKGR